jgi:hypothetical protein
VHAVRWHERPCAVLPHTCTCVVAVTAAGSVVASSACGSRQWQQSCSERAPDREGREANLWAPCEFKIQIKSKMAPNLIRSKHYHPSIQKVEIKYQETWFDVRNKLCHWSFFKFEKKFELKFRESRVVLNFGYLNKFLRSFRIL